MVRVRCVHSFFLTKKKSHFWDWINDRMYISNCWVDFLKKISFSAWCTAKTDQYILFKNHKRVTVKEDATEVGKNQHDFPGAAYEEYFNHLKCINAHVYPIKKMFQSYLLWKQNNIPECRIASCTWRSLKSLRRVFWSYLDSWIFDFKILYVETVCFCFKNLVFFILLINESISYFPYFPIFI